MNENIINNVTRLKAALHYEIKNIMKWKMK